jgi:hypothetical protein
LQSSRNFNDPRTELHRTLNNACRKWGAREIRLRYLPKPSLNRWIAEALIDHYRVIEKIRADIPAGELTLQDMESFNDQPIARGVSDTATDAIKTMWPLKLINADPKIITVGSRFLPPRSIRQN